MQEVEEVVPGSLAPSQGNAISALVILSHGYQVVVTVDDKTRAGRRVKKEDLILFLSTWKSVKLKVAGKCRGYTMDQSTTCCNTRLS